MIYFINVSNKYLRVHSTKSKWNYLYECKGHEIALVKYVMIIKFAS